MSNQHYFSHLLKKNLWIYFFSFLIAPLGYIVKIIMTRTISQEDYGIFVSVMSFVMILGAYNDFGMADSLNFFLPEHLHTKNKKKITETLSIALVTQILSSTVLAIVLFFLSDILAQHYFEAPASATLLHIFIIFFFWDNIFRSINTFFQSLQDTKLQKWTDFLRNIFQLVLIFGVSIGGHSSITYYAWAYNGSVILWIFVSIIILYYKYHTYFTLTGWFFWRHEYFKIFKYAIFVMLSANVGVILGQIDTQMIVVMLGTTQAWFYNIYLSLIRIPFIFLLPGVYFLFPVFSDLIKRWDVQKVQIIYTFCYELFSVVAVFMISFFILFWDVLTAMLFWSWYAISGKILLYSAPFLIFNFLLQIDFQLLNALWRPKTKMFILLFAVVVNLVTNFIFLKLWGIVGSAFASGIGWVFIWILSFREIKEYLNHFRWKMFLRNLLGVLFFSVLLAYLHIENLLSGRLQMFEGVLAVMLAYWVLFIILNLWEFLRVKKLFNIDKAVW